MASLLCEVSMTGLCGLQLTETVVGTSVLNMPVTVAVDSAGTSVHKQAPKIWQAKIGKIPVVVE